MRSTWLCKNSQSECVYVCVRGEREGEREREKERERDRERGGEGEKGEANK